MEKLLGCNGLFARRRISIKAVTRPGDYDTKVKMSRRPLTADGDFHGGRNGHVGVQVGRQADESARFVQQDQIRAVARHHPVVQLRERNQMRGKRISKMKRFNSNLE